MRDESVATQRAMLLSSEGAEPMLHPTLQVTYLEPALCVPRTPSVQVTRHVGTRGGCRRADRVVGCRGDRAVPVRLSVGGAGAGALQRGVRGGAGVGCRRSRAHGARGEAGPGLTIRVRSTSSAL